MGITLIVPLKEKLLVRPHLLLLKTDHSGDVLVTSDLDGPPDPWQVHFLVASTLRSFRKSEIGCQLYWL